MRELKLPKFNNNDDTCVLVEWMFADGDTVPAGSVVAEVETSKAIEELELDRPAVLHRLVDAGTEHRVGQTLAWLFDSEQERQEQLAQGVDVPAAEADQPASFVLSRPAQELADRHGIGPDQLRALGKQVIKTSDVQALVDATRTPATESTVELSRRQRAIAAVVTESHRDVPTAFAAIKVRLAPLDRLSTSDDADPVGLVELLIKAIALQRKDLPMLFAGRADDRFVRVPDSPGVAVTIDVGNGLFLPVVPGAAELRVDEVADRLMEFRIKAVRQDFREEDFAGAHITLSLHNEPGVVLARPIVFPGQSAMVVLCGTEQELQFDADGSVVQQDCTTIGVAYDHRVVNGREAMSFLQKIKQLLESLDRCAALIGRPQSSKDDHCPPTPAASM
ncbi:2-oxo acid dehydrogenase subunit E2 [Kutzneria sp. CA-103260]|uniref:2-oxo acid dehydrogenase subunit E2 n=1 Tax=Kutzneria sp. CA-103260 TaxID=2802641 RepID=UPI001BACA0D7|nr:2-oxo acid dehydrogenase subunit E2 [Kutzneria sp. CA-103260]QUQ67046.1 acyltransferase [Kutzneria sp. CA-103260]